MSESSRRLTSILLPNHPANPPLAALGLEGCFISSVPPPARAFPASLCPPPEAQITALGLKPPARRSAGVESGVVDGAVVVVVVVEDVLGDIGVEVEDLVVLDDAVFGAFLRSRLRD